MCGWDLVKYKGEPYLVKHLSYCNYNCNYDYNYNCNYDWVPGEVSIIIMIGSMLIVGILIAFDSDINDKMKSQNLSVYVLIVW